VINNRAIVRIIVNANYLIASFGCFIPNKNCDLPETQLSDRRRLSVLQKYANTADAAASKGFEIAGLFLTVEIEELHSVSPPVDAFELLPPLHNSGILRHLCTIEFFDMFQYFEKLPGCLIFL